MVGLEVYRKTVVLGGEVLLVVDGRYENKAEELAKVLERHNKGLTKGEVMEIGIVELINPLVQHAELPAPSVGYGAGDLYCLLPALYFKQLYDLVGCSVGHESTSSHLFAVLSLGDQGKVGFTWPVVVKRFGMAQLLEVSLSAQLRLLGRFIVQFVAEEAPCRLGVVLVDILQPPVGVGEGPEKLKGFGRVNIFEAAHNLGPHLQQDELPRNVAVESPNGLHVGFIHGDDIVHHHNPELPLYVDNHLVHAVGREVGGQEQRLVVEWRQ